ncbi:MAG TPA: phospholipase D family protein [Thermoleophilaceae bacterium]
MLAGAERLDAAVAFVTTSGVDLLRELFAESGTPSSVRIIVRGGPISDPDAVVALADLGAEVRVVMGAQASRFHPKLWIVGCAHATHVLSGSGNLTGGGLIHNHEQFELLHLRLPNSKREAAAHQARWDGFFALGCPLADAVLSPAWGEWIAQQSRRRQLVEELAGLDRRLANSRAPAPVGAWRGARRAGSRVSGHGDDLRWLENVLQAAVGDRYPAEISHPNWGRRVQANVGEGRGFKYLFLMPDHGEDQDDPSPALDLLIYPGDTLSQARRFYSRIDERARHRLIELAATPGWSVRPNFHLGFRARGWLHDTAPAALGRYLEYWHSHIDGHRERPAHEWPAILEGLARERIVSRDYPHRFGEEIGRRASLHPRPGLVIARTWSPSDVEQLDRSGELATAVRSASDQALAVIGERPLQS